MTTTTEDREAIAASHVPAYALEALADWEGRALDAEYVDEAGDRWMGEHATLTEWAEEYAEDTGMLAGMPEDLRYYFDHKRWADDAVLGGDITVVPLRTGEVLVFHN